MLESVWVKKGISGKVRIKHSLIADCKRMFDCFPHTVGVYDVNGEFIYSNNLIQNELINSHNTEKQNLLLNDKVVSTPVYSSFLKACQGEGVIIHSLDNYYEIFPWYLPDDKYELLIYPIKNDDSEVNLITIIHRKLNKKTLGDGLCPDEIKKLENNIAYSFLNNISHELRTPLNWIIGFSELINYESSMEKIKDFNRTINKGGVLLLSIIEKLMEVSNLSKNPNQMNISNFHVEEVLQEIYDTVKNEMAPLEKDIIMRLNCKLINGKRHISSDPFKLKQIFLNLIHNSLKFTQTGYIEIGVLNSPEYDYIFYVKDTGIGIEKVKQKYIFELFKKVENTDSMDQFGLGLGLSIVNNYVKLLGGQIWVESVVGVGSTFYFTVQNTDKAIIPPVFTIGSPPV
jgi:signal transduction histidine kinase